MNERKFIPGKWYLVIENYAIDSGTPTRMRLRGMAYSLNYGEKIKFRGKNLGRAEFLNKKGQLVILHYKTAFKILKVPEEENAPKEKD